MPKYDIAAVKQAADGRWPEIIASIAGVPIDILDGGHHPCPKCGGKDRFNLDRGGKGAVFCNQCQPGTGDGLRSLTWLTGREFKEILPEVAKFVSVEPTKKDDPAEHLEFLPWNPTIVGLWCLKKPPIKPAAIESIGGRMARYRGQYTVIAIPVWGPSLDKEKPVGWVIYRADGGKLPKHSKGSKEPEWVKVKVTHGSKKGVIAKCQMETA